MTDTLSEFLDHLERFRAVTLQMLDQVGEEDLAWRPLPEMMTLGQQFMHIAQGEDFMIRGLFGDGFDLERCRLPKDPIDPSGLRSLFARVRERTLAALDRADPEALVDPSGDPPRTPLSRLWAMLEHEIHHKAQIALYLRMLGIIPPFFAEPLGPGDRPDIALRQQYGGV